MEVAMHRSRANPMADTLPYVILFSVLWLQPIAAAPDLSDDQRQATQEIYERSEEEVRQRVDANVASFTREAEERNKRPLTNEELHTVRDLAIDAEYQKLVEMLT